MILIAYLIKVSLFTVLFYGVYFLFFRNETFYHVNRWYLLSVLPISFVLPLISIPIDLVASSGSPLEDLSQIAVLNLPDRLTNTTGQQQGFNWLLLVYLTGSIVVFSRGLSDVYQLWRVRNSNPIKSRGGYSLILNEQLPSFSFFRWIFTKEDPDQMDPSAELVLHHEIAHARYWHSADIIGIRIIQALLWFNPVIRLYKNALQEIHEFQADQVVLAGGADLSVYIQSIMEEIMHNRSYKLASHFTNSQIKKRVIMATKNSSHLAGWKYLLVLPVFVAGLLSFSFQASPDQSMDSKDNPPTILPIEKAKVTNIGIDFGGGPANDHPGIDFAAPIGTPIVATASGVVKKAGEKGDYGNLIYIAHDEHYATLYAHLSKMKVKEGDQVKQGDVIGFVGNTGKSTGPHLHYEVRYDGEQVNPKKLLSSK